MHCPLKVLIKGGGPTGSILALALAKHGAHVCLFDPKNRTQLINKSRAYAITHSTRRLFQNIDIWNDLNSHITLFDQLSIEDRETSTRLNLRLSDLPERNNKYGAIGWVLDHKRFMEVVLPRLDQSTSISLNLGSDISANLKDYDFVFAADGPFSRTRKDLKIKPLFFPYRQGCLTTKVLIRGVSPGTAYEIFREEGPLALLPMGGDLFQVIWSGPFNSCQARSKLNHSSFLDSLARVLPNGFEPDVVIDNPAAFPLGFSICPKFDKEKFLLLGESAHRCHPVGGQGLNVCWRDVMEISNLFLQYNRGTIVKSHIPCRYTRNRILDVLSINIITDLIIRIFSNRNPLFMLSRKLVFHVIKCSSYTRKLILGLMTEGFPGFVSYSLRSMKPNRRNL
ncbi:FAD-dependent monooxygenase [Prochlorococcus sp. MIT 1300]|uniref:FAD-dependent monooxygenase n=1 Tax=Prochlorococcus sp. MIT 1300 TaxID=3096218 RepID=UPI002A74965B|nr:FAD-dependent monooxygenase [Prochlorococcus sp. MIT 1300]